MPFSLVFSTIILVEVNWYDSYQYNLTLKIANILRDKLLAPLSQWPITIHRIFLTQIHRLNSCFEAPFFHCRVCKWKTFFPLVLWNISMVGETFVFFSLLIKVNTHSFISATTSQFLTVCDISPPDFALAANKIFLWKCDFFNFAKKTIQHC